MAIWSVPDRRRCPPTRLLILDEPEQRLDPDARRRLAELLIGEKKDGVAVLPATHQADLAESVADLAVTAYALVLLAGGYGSTFAYRFVRSLQGSAAQGDTVEMIGRSLPAGPTLVGPGLALVAARDALGRGPVVVPASDAAWLLGRPVDRARKVKSWSSAAVSVLVLLGAQTAWAAAGHRLPVVERIELWSGPWGCAAQPVVGPAAGGAPGRPYAVALLVVLTVVGVWLGNHAADEPPSAHLPRTITDSLESII
ncbi:AAA family ATPase [Streptomyces inhibens]|uniref:AAA family ATPase n=1 Tax=Streptomyces inhibens TaxID=2293571 RepID=UPI003CC9E9A6